MSPFVIRKSSLARIFVMRLLIGCAAFAMVVVGLQISWEYRIQSYALKAELESFATSFEPGVESAIWDFQTTLLQAQANGLGNNQKIVLVRILDEKEREIAFWKSSNGDVASDKYRLDKPIVHYMDGVARRIGTLTIYSSESVIASLLWDRLWKTTSLLILVLGFCFLILWVTGDRLIVRPLVRFANLVDEQINQIHGSTIDLGPGAAAEIARLEDGFNLLMTRIGETQEKIRHQNAELEKRVVERTREVIEKERQFRTIFERANVGIVFADSNGNIVSFNENFARLTGYAPGSLTGTSFASPTAVITESSEKMISSTAICAKTAANPATAFAALPSSSPSRLLWISRVLFQSRNRPPMKRMRSRPETSWVSTIKNGSGSCITHVMDSSRAMRVTMASPSPRTRALFRFARGSLPTRIEMKMMLSMPSTISSAVRVMSAIQA